MQGPSCPGHLLSVFSYSHLCTPLWIYKTDGAYHPSSICRNNLFIIKHSKGGSPLCFSSIDIQREESVFIGSLSTVSRLAHLSQVGSKFFQSIAHIYTQISERSLADITFHERIEDFWSFCTFFFVPIFTWLCDQSVCMFVCLGKIQCCSCAWRWLDYVCGVRVLQLFCCYWDAITCSPIQLYNV